MQNNNIKKEQENLLLQVWLAKKGTVLIGQNESLWFVGWWSWWGYSCVAPNRWGKLQSYWLKYNFRNFSIRAGSRGKNTLRVGSLVLVSPWSAICVRGPCVEIGGRPYFLNLSPVSHCKPFWVVMFFPRGPLNDLSTFYWRT